MFIKSSTALLFSLMVSDPFIHIQKNPLDYESWWNNISKILVHKHSHCSLAPMALKCLSQWQSAYSQLKKQRQKGQIIAQKQFCCIPLDLVQYLIWFDLLLFEVFLIFTEWHYTLSLRLHRFQQQWWSKSNHLFKPCFKEDWQETE